MLKFFAGAVLAAASVAPAAAATLVGAYGFGNSLASSQPGGPTLGLIDPTGTSGYGSDTVFGETRTVFNFRGTAANAQQSGLVFTPTTALTPNSYSLAMTFKFNERDGAWRRIYDVTGRTSDTGFYVDPSNKLAVFPVSGSSVNFVAGVYRRLVVTVDGTSVNAYLDGDTASLSTVTDLLNIAGGPGSLTFFADNVQGGGQGEWSSGSIAALRVYNGVLTQAEIRELINQPFVNPPQGGAVPEPASWAMMIVGFGLGGAAMRRRRGALRLA